MVVSLFVLPSFSFAVPAEVENVSSGKYFDAADALAQKRADSPKRAIGYLIDSVKDPQLE